MQCPRCQTQNEAGARFCEDCGARLEMACPSCGAPVTTGKKFCRSCGARRSYRLAVQHKVWFNAGARFALGDGGVGLLHGI
jgi:hypothetical protein